MEKLREVCANPNSKVTASWYSVSEAEATDLMGKEGIKYKSPASSDFNSEYMHIYLKSGNEILSTKESKIHYILFSK